MNETLNKLLDFILSFTTNDIVDILNTGATGLAFILLFIGFKLTSKIQNKILDKNIEDINNKKLELWSKITDKQLKNTRYFMMFATIFLLVSLAVSIYRPEAEIVVSITPTRNDFTPVIHAQESKIDINKFGKGLARLKNEELLQINNQKLFEQIDKLNRELFIYKATSKTMIEEDTKISSEAGFDIK